MDENIIELDVRSHLRKKLEPFKLIMDTVKSLNKEDTFVLHAIFKPTPLLGVMRTKGYVNKVEKLASDHWIVTFVHKSRKHELNADFSSEEAPELEQDDDPELVHEPQTYELDNRGLEPPQPMIRTLSRLEKAKPGDQVKIHNDRVPMFLIEELNALGYPYEVDEQADSSAKVTIHKK